MFKRHFFIGRITTTPIFIFLLLFSFAFLLGCTSSDVITMPFTESQFYSRTTDLNYDLFVSGYYDGNFVVFDGNKLSVGVIDISSEDINWSQLINFPSGCADNQAVKIVGNELVCVDLPVDTNIWTEGYTNNSLIDWTNASEDFDTSGNIEGTNVDAVSYNSLDGTNLMSYWGPTSEVYFWQDVDLQDNDLETTGDITANTFYGDWNGSGNYVPYTGATGDVDLGSNDLTVNTNTLFVDATNNNVGIGTTSPTATLEISGSSYPVLRGTRTTTSTTGVASGLDFLRKTTGNMADSFGGGMTFSIEDDAGVANYIGGIYVERNGADNKGNLLFYTNNGGTVSPLWGPRVEIMNTGRTNLMGNGSSAHTPLAFMSPVLTITDDYEGVSGVSMQNLGTGTSSDFRFLIKDSTDHYFTFSQPSTSHTGTLFGLNRAETDYLFNSGGTARDLVIMNNQEKSLYLGTDGELRLEIDSAGDIHNNADNRKLYMGAGDDYSQYFDGTNQNFELDSGVFNFDKEINVNGGNVNIVTSGTSSLGATPTGRGLIISGDNANSRWYYENNSYTSGRRVFLIDNGAGAMSFSSTSDDGSAFVFQNILNLRYNGKIGIGGVGTNPGEQLTMNNNLWLQEDDGEIIQGAGKDFKQYFDGTNQNFDLTSGDFVFNSGNVVVDNNIEGDYIIGTDFITKSKIGDFSETNTIDKYFKNVLKWKKADGNIDYLMHPAGTTFTRQEVTGLVDAWVDEETCVGVTEEVCVYELKTDYVKVKDYYERVDSNVLVCSQEPVFECEEEEVCEYVLKEKELLFDDNNMEVISKTNDKYEKVCRIVETNCEQKESCSVERVLKQEPVIEPVVYSGLSLETRVAELEKMVWELNEKNELLKARIVILENRK